MFRTSIRRLTAGAAAAATASGLALAGLSPLPALAASKLPVPVPVLHQSAPILLGTYKNFTADAFAQAPARPAVPHYPAEAAGSLFYTLATTPKVVYVIKAGTTVSKAALHLTSGPVIALAANATGVFVQVGLGVTEYSRTGGAVLRTWTLSSPYSPITSAGLIPDGNVLWSWTDWATDKSGFQYATISRMTLTSSAVHVVSGIAYPGDVAATAAGLYFQGYKSSNGFLGLAPLGGGAATTVVQPNVAAPMAAWGSYVEVLSVHSVGHVYVDSYDPASLAVVYSKVVTTSDRNIVATGAGLLSLREPCVALYCAGAKVSVVNPATGAETKTIGVWGAWQLLPGVSGAVIVVDKYKLWLVRVTP